MSQPAKRPSAVSTLIYIALVGLGVWRLARPGELSTGATVWAWVMVVGGAIGLLMDLLVRFLPATTPGGAAEAMLEQQKTLYAGKHKYRRVAAQAFEGLDVNYYEKTRTRLETLGFRYLGDVEDLTVASTSNFLKMQAVLRIMAGEGGTVTAAVYHVRMFGLPRLLQIVGVLPRKMKVIDLESELTDGRHVCTANTLESDTTAPFPGISKRRYPADTPVEQLIEHHRTHLYDALAADPDAQPIYVASLEDVLECQNRQERIKAAHKARIGFINETELKSVLGKDELNESERQVLAEVRRLQRREDTPRRSSHPTA
jgi:hypothetical protein